jgi:FixJ family two-component response regulator
MDQAVGMVAAPVVYIVEDDEAVRDSFAAFLDASGMEARCFGSAEEYLTARDGCLGGCLLLDLNLPGMGGLDMLEHLRAKGDNLPAVIVTARRSPQVDERARRAGALAIFDKPVDWQALLAKIEEALNRSSA